VNAGEQIYFKVSGAYDIHLTGNFVIPENEIMDSDDEESDDEEGMGGYSMEDLLDEQDLSGDELDDLEDPRVMEVDSEEEAPKLIKSKKEEKKNKKRSADDSDDEEISKDALKKLLKTEDPTENGEKLSKKQKKKLKNNAGEPAEAPKAESKPAEKKAAKDVKVEKDNASANGSGKKVQFADKLEQGPTPTKADNNKGPKAWTVNGVKIDQRKPGSGPGAKKGDKVGMRYIGKLKDGKQFDGKLLYSNYLLHSGTNPHF
jgi:FK506-binding nuclear protein